MEYDCLRGSCCPGTGAGLKVFHSLDDQPKRASAGACTAAAWHTAQIYRVVVVPRQFLTLPDIPSANQENVTVGVASLQVWIAAMVSELSATAPHSPIQTIAVLQFREIDILGELQLRRLPPT